MISDVSSNQLPTQTVEVIGIGRRLVAYLIDWVILDVIVSIVTIAIGLAGTSFAEINTSTMTQLNRLAQSLTLLITGAYFVIFWVMMNGQTPGKMALGIKVIATDGSSMTIGKAILRFIGYLISGFIIWLGFIWIAFDGKRQGWHDKIAKTYVVPKDTQFSAIDAVTIAPSDSTKAATIIVWSVMVWVIGPMTILFLWFILLFILALRSGVGPFIYTLF